MLNERVTVEPGPGPGEFAAAADGRFNGGFMEFMSLCEREMENGSDGCIRSHPCRAWPA